MSSYDPEAHVYPWSPPLAPLNSDDRTEGDLLFNRAQLAAIVEASADAIFSRDLDGRILTWNGGAARMFGYAPSQIVGRSVGVLVSPRAGLDLPALLAAVAAGDVVKEREMVCVRQDGSEFSALTTVSPIRDDAGRVVAAASVVHDISDRKQAEEKFDEIFNLSPDMICTASYDGYLTLTNPAFEQVLGHSSETLRSVPFLEFIHPDDREATRAELARVVSGETTFGFANRYRTAAGTFRWIEWHARASTRDAIIYGVGRDETERRNLERQLQQAQKMEAIGQLAGGVAHDFNNIITAINGFSELAMDNLPPDHPVRADLGEVRAAADRAAALTRQLLAFSRKQVLAPVPLDLREAIDTMSSMVRRVIGEDVELRVEGPGRMPPVFADRGQVEQVVMNLAVNARDAMPKGGTLRIELAEVDLDGAYVAEHPGARPGAHVRLSISDTGCGMSEEVRARLFEPFFTTKEEGRGTGLGLSTVYGVVKQSGGSIAVHSEPGRGSTFEIFLPRHTAR